MRLRDLPADASAAREAIYQLSGWYRAGRTCVHYYPPGELPRCQSHGMFSVILGVWQVYRFEPPPTVCVGWRFGMVRAMRLAEADSAAHPRFP